MLAHLKISAPAEKARPKISTFPSEEERGVRAPRSLNQQQDGAASSQSVIPGGAQWSAPEQWSLALVPSGIGSKQALAAQPTAVVRLGFVDAQSTLCSSKRQSVLQVQSTLQVPVSFEPWLTCQDNLLASQRRQAEIHQREIQ